MEFFVIGAAALLTSLLTFISGFGLGTLLMPVFAIFFPVETAISLTAIVHFLNNIFKLLLIGKAADIKVVIRFGLPAIAGAAAGALSLVYLSDSDDAFSFTIGQLTLQTTLLNISIGTLIILFALLELKPVRLTKKGSGSRSLIAGGIISGFFGGLSGHQGAMRSAFLIKLGLTKETFIATGIIIATAIDVTRLSVYFSKLEFSLISENSMYLVVGTLSAFAGAIAGRLLLKKVSLTFIHVVVAIALFVLGTAMIIGVV